MVSFLDFDQDEYETAVLDEIRREAKQAVLPGCRLMTVRTLRGKGLYEYVSVSTGFRKAKSGEVYETETRYPIIGGEMRPRKRGGPGPDQVANEELGVMGLPPYERTPDLLVDMIRRKAVK